MKFKIIYADPAWSYNQGGRGSTEDHYEGMSIAEIQALPVSDIADDDAVLFLWVTWPFLAEGLATIRAWGFEYKTCAFVWVKHHEKSGKKCVGGGFWTRANTEFCLIGVRGKKHPRRIDKSVRQLIETEPEEFVLEAPRGRHSAKPKEARARIVQLMGDVPRVELFARERIEGWHAWGDDSALGDSDIDLVVDDSSAVKVNSSPSLDEQGDETMASLPKDMAEAIGKAKTAGGGDYIQHGDYIFLIKKWFYQRVQDRCIIHELLVIDSHGKIVHEGTKSVQVEPNAIGSSPGYTVNFDGKGKLSADGNARAVVLGLFGFIEGEVADQTVSATLSEVCDEAKQPASFMLIACSTYPKEISSNKGNYITGLNWSCVAKPGTGVNAPDQVAARKAAFAQSPEACVRLAWQQLGKGEPVFNAPVAAPASNGTAHAAAPPAAAIAPSAFSAMSAPAAAPSLPPAPAVPPPPIAVVDPFAGWTVHPQDPSFYYRGQEVKAKADLLAAAGK